MKLKSKLIVFLFLMTMLVLFPYTVRASDSNVYRGSGDRQSVTDVMQGYADGDYTDINKDQMQKGTTFVQQKVGYLISVILIILYASMAVVTAIDLAWIAVPAVRPNLYVADNNSGNAGQHVPGQQNTQTNTNNSKKTCLITSELRTLVDAKVPSNILLKEYFKKRIVVIILIVILTILFIQSTVFMKMGLNIGGLLLKIFYSVVG